MNVALSTLFWFSVACLYFAFDGYGRLLGLLVRIRHAGPWWHEAAAGDLPGLTVLVTVHNEAQVMASRIANILSCDYPADRLAVLVASDGSTDGTDDLVRAADDTRVQLFAAVPQRGKSATQNQALTRVTTPIVVFSDADTSFSRDFLREIAKPFADPRVGGVDGRLLFESASGSGVSGEQSRYWRYELLLRERESFLGILAVASGACFAVRRELLVPVAADTGEDCVVPLDVVLAGRHMVHVPSAVAHDRFDSTSHGEFKARSRMTLRNVVGTFSKGEVFAPWRTGFTGPALFAHKILRWLSPFFLIGATVSSALLSLAPGAGLYRAALAAFTLLYGMGAIGFLCERKGISMPLARTAYSFLLANAGFLNGWVRVLRGTRVVKYT